MRKELTYTIDDSDSGLPLKAVLSKRLHLSRREISRLKFSGGLFLNGESCRVTEPVKTGDAVRLVFMEKDTAHAVRLLGRPDILYEDEDLVIVNKPSGMPCHPSHEHLDDDMGTLLKGWYHGRFTVRAVGRLDKDVSGIMLYAKNQPAAARLSAQRGADELVKTYLAVCEGHFPERSGVLRYTLRKVPGRKDRVISDEGQTCITEYEVVQEAAAFSLVKIHIVTGRTHQIRAGMAHFGHPLAGDRLYGGSCARLARPALHCAHLVLKQPFSGRRIEADCPMPAEMEALLK